MEQISDQTDRGLLVVPHPLKIAVMKQLTCHVEVLNAGNDGFDFRLERNSVEMDTPAAGVSYLSCFVDWLC